MQDACTQALEQWRAAGLPANPTGWVVAVAKRRATDHLRREAARSDKERLAVQGWDMSSVEEADSLAGDDQLALLFACCHPALEPNARVTLTLRVVGGLPVPSIARLLLLPEPTVAQRLVRTKRKIRDAGIRLKVPAGDQLPVRLNAVLKVVYLTFTEGHSPSGVDAVVREDLCQEAVRLARALHALMPDEPEVIGLLALLRLTAARSAARVDADGAMVLLPGQDRGAWDREAIAEGHALTVQALSQQRPGPYQLQAAIAACHADAATAEDTDWRQIALLYSELLRYDPSPVVEANRAVAVAYAEGIPAGLTILDTLAGSSELARWPQLHIARAGLLARDGQAEEAVAAYRDALALEPPAAVRTFITSQLAGLRDAADPPTIARSRRTDEPRPR